MSYLNKWVVIYKSPSNANRRIGKVLVLYIKEETVKQVRGTDHLPPETWQGFLEKAYKSDVVRVVNVEEKNHIQHQQMLLNRRFKEAQQALEKKYSAEKKRVANLVLRPEYADTER